LGKGDIRIYDNVDHFAYLDARYRDESILERARIAAMYHRTDEAINRFSCRKTDNGLVANLLSCGTLDKGEVTRLRRYRDTVDTFGFLGEVQLSMLDGRFRILTGAEGYLDLVGSRLDTSETGLSADFSRQNRGNFSDGSFYLQSGAFAYVEGELFEDPGFGVLTASVGARGTYASASAPDVPGLGDVAYEDLGVVFTGGLRQTFKNRYALYSNFSQGFRLPNLQEATVLGDVGSVFEVPNDELGAETSHTLEVGGRVIHPVLNMSVGYFHSWVTDLIVREATTYGGDSVVDGKDVFRRVNAGEGRFYGVQGLWETGSFLGFSLSGHVAWTFGEVDTVDGEREPARRVPPLYGRASLHYSSGDSPFRITAYVDWADRKTDLSPKDKKDLRICGDANQPGLLKSDCDSVDGYAIPGVSVKWSPHEAISIHADVRNILDTKYRTFGSGFDAPGMGLHLGAVIDF